MATMDRHRERELPDWMAGVKKPIDEVFEAAERKYQRLKRGVPASDDEIAAGFERVREALLAAVRTRMGIKPPQ